MDTFEKLRKNSLSHNIIEEKRLILHPGDFGKASKGGIYNGDIVDYCNKVIMISRVEKNHSRHLSETRGRDWWKSENCYPVISIWDKDIVQMEEYFILEYKNYPKIFRAEDYRLFIYDGEIYCNHFIICEIDGNHIASMALSKIDLDKKVLKFISIPHIDKFNMNNIEKNWSYFEHNNKLKILYSIDPWIIVSVDEDILRNNIEINLNFKSISIPVNFMGISTNIINFSDNSYIVYYHNRFDDIKSYVHGAIIVDKKNLTPLKQTRFPFYLGYREENVHGGFENVLYISGAIDRDDHQLLIYGSGDYSTGIMKIDKEEIIKSMFRCGIYKK